MKAAYIEQTGPADNIVYGELPDPNPSPNDVLVKLIATTVDPIDTYIRSGTYHVELPLPFIVGRDLVGKVVSVGPEVTNFKVGELVWSNNQGYGGRQGAAAELLCVQENYLYPLPAGADPVETVAVLHSALTAVAGLFWKAQVKSGETIFINGGSGNVGSAIIQLAKSRGARVAVTAGNAAKRDWAIECGADLVIDYHNENIETQLSHFSPQGIDIFWDTSGKPDFETALPSMAQRGRMIIMAGLHNRASIPLGLFYTKNLTLFGFTITSLSVAELAAGASAISENLQILKAKIHSKMRLSETAEAHKLIESGKLFGKIILLPDD
jgi:NADPH2:quinone reductase